MEYGLIGEKLGHSFSKEIHALIADYDYELKELKKEELGSFLEKKEFKGINVTIPYKKDVIPYLDEISPEAEAIGAVNCIVNSGGRLFGYNTDFYGLRALILHTGIDMSGKTVLIGGTGGTSDTAKAVCESLGAARIFKASRSGRVGAYTYEEAEAKCADAAVFINATPCGMYPNLYDCPIELEKYPKLEGVIDVIYNPLRSELVSAALKRGLAAAGGLYMLVGQAVKAAELFIADARGNAGWRASALSLGSEALCEGETGDRSRKQEGQRENHSRDQEEKRTAAREEFGKNWETISSEGLHENATDISEKQSDVGDILLDRVFGKIYSDKENIVLTGMPGSGKSTIGAAISAKTGRELIDTDELIVEMAGMPITEIFSRFGEAHFRDLETEAVKQAAARSGVIIATGGGAVLRSENVAALKMNGRIFYIDRPLSMLLPTDDRPLAGTREAIIKRFEERHEIYEATADAIVENSGTVEGAMWKILRISA